MPLQPSRLLSKPFNVPLMRASLLILNWNLSQDKRAKMEDDLREGLKQQHIWCITSPRSILKVG